MIYLLLAVVCSVLLGFQFKLFPRFGVDTFQAIVFNYFTCVACATVHIGQFPIESADFDSVWMPFALFLGFVFITGFNAAAATVRNFGVTISQIMQKMSLLMSVPFAILWFGESAGWMKILGIVVALVSIILVNLSDKSLEKTASDLPKHNWFLLGIPFATWFLAGIIEVVFVKVQHEKMIAFGDVSFISTVFGTAGLLGFTVAAAGWLSGRLQFSWKNVAAGILLGIPNYGSMLFILLALGSGLEASFFFPVCNVGIILTTSLGAVFLFREQLSQVNWLGIGLAVLAIFLMAF